MKIKLKAPITTKSGVTYPEGYSFECDNLLNLPNGLTILSNVAEPRPGLIVADELFQVGVRDLHKLEVQLEYPA